MDVKAVSVDWGTTLPVLISVLAPTITGFLQQFSKNFVEKAPWWAKGVITAAVAGLIATIGSYATEGDAMLAGTLGVVVGAFGAVNIALRKGSRGNLEVIINQQLQGKADPK